MRCYHFNRDVHLFEFGGELFVVKISAYDKEYYIKYINKTPSWNGLFPKLVPSELIGIGPLRNITVTKMEGVSLLDISTQMYIPMSAAFYFTWQLLRFCKKANRANPPFIHQDLKADNIIVIADTNTNRIKYQFIDFDSQCPGYPKTCSYQYYKQSLTRKVNTEKEQIYQVLIIFLVLATGSDLELLHIGGLIKRAVKKGLDSNSSVELTKLATKYRMTTLDRCRRLLAARSNQTSIAACWEYLKQFFNPESMNDMDYHFWIEKFYCWAAIAGATPGKFATHVSNFISRLQHKIIRNKHQNQCNCERY